MELSLKERIEEAAASFSFEGIYVSEEVKDLCMRMLSGEITKEEYYRLVREKQGIKVG